jgi:pimeloyl-ACP methyl ester carboxylesterase
VRGEVRPAAARDHRGHPLRTLGRGDQRGASTGAGAGAGAALIAAAERPQRVAAVVSRGGRPDLAAHSLRRVGAPTLLIVGGMDGEVIRLNRLAQSQLAGESQLVIVAGAGHLFAEPGALEEVAALARDWFQEHL